ncbi:MAG TPA: phosphodiester glycosidase family protein, partial [Capsulimonadaceae bacterium]|nr:phosphodiester glycosidase family protein [Capsulimonadaceae bacterium]
IGGGPWLVQGGQITVDAIAEGFDDSFANDPNPRTAVGQTADGDILLVTVDGRQKLSKGVSLSQMAQIMKRLGAVNAINFDGGGSTTMAAAGMIVNSPSGSGVERPVADMLLVYGAPPSDPQAAVLSVTTPSNSVTVGDSLKLSARAGGTQLLDTDPDLLWGGAASNGVGFVTQDGVFHALHTGTGTVSANYRGQHDDAQITVVGPTAAPARYAISARFMASPSGAPNRSELVIRIVDANGMPLQSGAVHVSVSGGTADAPDLTTSADGTATTGITWDKASGSATISSGKLSTVTLSYGGGSGTPISKQQQIKT